MRYQGPYTDSIKTATRMLSAEDHTYTREGLIADVRKGYAVGGAVPALKLHKHDYDVIRVAKWIEALPSTVQKIGVWTDGAYRYFDAVNVIENYFDAVLLGIQRGEKAIYDFTAGKEERLS